MRPAALAGIVAVVFAVGLVVGLALTSGGGEPDGPPAADPSAAAGSPAAASPSGGVDLPGPEAGPDPDATPGAGPSGAPRPPEPPPPPPPIPPDALAEGERTAAEGATDEEPKGRVVTLTDPFESDAERAAHEAEERARWERRLGREIELTVAAMRERAGLGGAQEAGLRRILEAELAERMRLTDALAAKELSGASFDEAVVENTRRTRRALEALLSPEQLEALDAIDARALVLEEEQ